MLLDIEAALGEIINANSGVAYRRRISSVPIGNCSVTKSQPRRPEKAPLFDSSSFVSSSQLNPPEQSFTDVSLSWFLCV